VVSVRGLTGLFLAVVGVLVVTGAAAARRSGPRPVPGQRAALAAVKRAVGAGHLTAAEARSDRGAIAQSVHLVRVLPSGRRARVEVALGQVGALGKRLTAPRAEAVFGQLRANNDYFARHGSPGGGTDITDADGVVYRYFAGRCFEFHPLANMSALNAHATAKDVAATERLATALIARAVPRNGGAAWEYYFPYGGGRAPWVSGMAQAVAAQAFSRAAALATDESTTFSYEAAAAFATVPRLTRKVAAGPWIRLYSFSSMQVLNAQLQSLLSLQTYANASNNSAAATLASQMEQAAAASVSRFDTGYWTYYSLGGAPTPLSYQKFIVQLLHKLAPDDARFAAAAARFAVYLRQPPAFKLASASGGTLRFWLSKPASVSASTPAGRTLRLGLRAGWQTLRWREPKRAGFYAIHVTAVDWAGNRASFTALPIVHAPGSGRPQKGVPRPSGAGAPIVESPLATGVGIDDPGQASLAGSLGLSLVRMTVAWQPGETAPDPAVVGSLKGLPSGAELVLDLEAAELPSDDAGRTALADYAASLARQTPALRNLVLTPAPSRELAPRYANALAAVGTAVRSVRSDVAVGPFLDGSTPKPSSTALAFARQLAQDGGRADLVSFLPAPIPGAGAWAVGDLGNLESTLAKGLGNAPPVLLDVVPTPTTVPSSEQGSYPGGAPPQGSTVDPSTQASTYARAIEAASCLPDVSGVLLDRLVDDHLAPQPPSGLYYASGDAKPSARAVEQAIGTVARGAAVCPGLAASVTPTTLTFPGQLSRTAAASVVLGCSRDCLYLVTLDRANGRPLVARRGSLNGADVPRTIVLPKRKLPAGSYRLDVRLVSRVDPGALDRERSGLLSAG
jgi:D-glucuronyl C5-epimerase C-terminus